MKRASQQQMEAAVASFRSSGLTQREFCLRENIKLPTFSYWYRKVNGSSATPPVGFTEVTAPVHCVGLEVVFPNGVTVRGSRWDPPTGSSSTAGRWTCAKVLTD